MRIFGMISKSIIENFLKKISNHKYFAVLLALIAVNSSLFGQNKFELDLSVENDLFALTEDEDRYYSSGIFASVRKPLKSESKLFIFFNKKTEVDHITHGLRLRQLIYTSDILNFTDIRRQDRPFAGLLSLGYHIDVYQKNNLILAFTQDIGLVGPSSGTSTVHTWWHDQLNLLDPTSWEFQIENKFLFNSRFELIKAFQIVKNRIDLVYESRYELGTVFNNIRQEGMIRIGLLEILSKSGYRNGILGTHSSSPDSKKMKEIYIFLGMGTEYVFGNYTIEGDFPGKENAPINNIEEWLFLTKSGFNIHWNKMDIGWHFFFNSKENTRAKKHKYARIRVTKRF